VNAIIAHQESLITHLRGYQEEDEREPKRLAANSKDLLVQLTPTVIYQYRDTLPTLPTLIPLDQLLSSQKAGRDATSFMLPLTERFLTDWTAARHALAAPLSSLRAPMKEIKQFVVPIADGLASTEVLKGQITDAAPTLSDMIQYGLWGVKSKTLGILHPLRCLPLTSSEVAGNMVFMAEERHWEWQYPIPTTRRGLSMK